MVALLLVLEPNQSVTKQVLIAAIHLVAAIAFGYADLPLATTTAALVTILASGLACTCAEQDQLPVFEFDDAGAVTINRCGVLLHAGVLPTSTDMGWAIWLQWREVSSLSGAGRRRSGALMLMPDQFTPSEWRQLRIWLRHNSSAVLNDDRAEV